LKKPSVGNLLGRIKMMKNREKLLDEVFELALHNDMTYFG